MNRENVDLGMESALDYYTRKIDGFKAMSFEERRSAAQDAKLSDKQHTKTTLKELFRVKPSKEAKSDYGYKNDFGTYVNCYRLDQCVPMRPLSNKPRTEKQKQATANLIKQNLINSEANQAAILAKTMIENDVVVIDTETTDLDGVVIQISVVSAMTAKVLFESYVYTSEPISEGAFEKHGISEKLLKGAPSFEEVAKAINELLGHRYWTAFNTQFDEQVIRNSISGDAKAEHYGWIKRQARCVMYDVAVPTFGSTNKYGSISLADTLACCRLHFDGEAHDSSVDAVATAKVLQHIAKLAIDE